MDAFSSLPTDVKMQLGESAPWVLGTSGRANRATVPANVGRPTGTGSWSVPVSLTAPVAPVVAAPVTLPTLSTERTGDSLGSTTNLVYSTSSPMASQMAPSSQAFTYTSASPVYSPSAPVVRGEIYSSPQNSRPGTAEVSRSLPMEPLSAFLASPQSSPPLPTLSALQPTVTPMEAVFSPVRGSGLAEAAVFSPVRSSRLVESTSQLSPMALSPSRSPAQVSTVIRTEVTSPTVITTMPPRSVVRTASSPSPKIRKEVPSPKIITRQMNEVPSILKSEVKVATMRLPGVSPSEALQRPVTGSTNGGADAVLVDGFWERCDEGGSHRKGLSRRLSSSMQDVVNQRESYRATKASRPASCFEGLFKHQDPVKKVDVLLVGGGIMSATLALLLKQLEPDWKIVMIERLAEVAQESSNGWNNAGTGHSALCEPNYTPEAGKTVDIHKAVTVNENFQLSRQYWAHLAEKGLVSPSKFISQTPHMTFAHGEEQIAWLKKRFEALKGHPLFQGMEYTEDPEKMKSWAPLMMEGRDDKERCAFTRVPDGTDVDFGELTKELTKAFISLGGDVQLMTTVCDFAKDQSGLYDETWIVTTRKSQGLSRKPTQYRARFVFIGAGGYALPLLQKTKIPDVRGFMGFP
ncbi:unnamed protein product, partial [Durusdinium trenchii]